MVPQNTAIGSIIAAGKEPLAREVMERQLRRQAQPSGPHEQLEQENSRQTLAYLSQAITVSHPILFLDYVAWAKVMLAARNIAPDWLQENLLVTRDVLTAHLPPENVPVVVPYIDEALDEFPQMPLTVASEMKPGDPLHDLAGKYFYALQQGQRRLASELILTAVDAGIPIKDIYLHVFQKVMYETGRRWQLNEMTVADEHYCTAATQLVMSQLYPRMLTLPRKPYPLIATAVSGEQHDLGIRTVADFFEMEGWDTYYTGANTPAPSLIQTLARLKPQIMAISVATTLHIEAASNLIAAVRTSPEGRRLKILVGGHPFNLATNLWRQIGADGWASNADDATTVAAQLLNGG